MTPMSYRTHVHLPETCIHKRLHVQPRVHTARAAQEVEGGSKDDGRGVCVPLAPLQHGVAGGVEKGSQAVKIDAQGVKPVLRCSPTHAWSRSVNAPWSVPSQPADEGLHVCEVAVLDDLVEGLDKRLGAEPCWPSPLSGNGTSQEGNVNRVEARNAGQHLRVKGVGNAWFNMLSRSHGGG